eukprot:2913327-Amphidinium_carterae.1
MVRRSQGILDYTQCAHRGLHGCVGTSAILKKPMLRRTLSTETKGFPYSRQKMNLTSSKNM